MALEFFSTCWQYWRKAGELAWERRTHQHGARATPSPELTAPAQTSLRVTATAAMAWLWGPPCREGKTAKLILSSKS